MQLMLWDLVLYVKVGLMSGRSSCLGHWDSSTGPCHAQKAGTDWALFDCPAKSLPRRSQLQLANGGLGCYANADGPLKEHNAHSCSCPK
jgi:hypothetical protein